MRPGRLVIQASDRETGMGHLQLRVSYFVTKKGVTWNSSRVVTGAFVALQVRNFFAHHY